MTRKIPDTAFWISILFGAAFGAAVFFQGSYAEFLCLAQSLLFVWLLVALWENFDAGIRIPKTGVLLCMTLYWVWLAVAAFWGRVAYLGVLNFWWLGSLPLTFWIYSLSPQRNELWRYCFYWAVCISVALAVVAAYQALVYGGQSAAATFLNRNSLAALLNLVAIPLCGYFLLSINSGSGVVTWQRWVYGVAIFVLVLAIALIQGRGAIISGAVSLLLLIGVAWKYVPKRALAMLVVIVAIPFVIASFEGHVGVSQRFESVVSNPYAAGTTRFVIWRQSWELLKESPWMGVGLGHYSLYWPPYRDPSDDSGGYFAHNDYLQFWIEAGLPGLLILLAVLIAVAVMYMRAMRKKSSPSHKIEITALFAGLFAVAMHSFVDFNLYVLATLILAGLVLGRLHVLASSAITTKTFLIMPSTLMTKAGYRIFTVLIVSFAFLYFFSLGVSSIEYQRGLRLAAESKLEEAYTVLDKAARLYPYADNVLMSKADLLRHIISTLPASASTQKKEFYDETEELLTRAESLNPLRSQTFAIHAFFYEQNSALVGSGWAEKVIGHYRRALVLEPRAYQVRYLYARFLLTQKRQEEAHQLMEAGMQYIYPSSDIVIPYYGLAAGLRAAAGDREGAAMLQKYIKDIARVK